MAVGVSGVATFGLLDHEWAESRQRPGVRIAARPTPAVRVRSQRATRMFAACREPQEAMSDTTKTLLVAVAGILVSGVVGPAVTAWATRRANRQQFERDQAAKRREDFRSLVDDAAKLLGAGVTNLRIGREAREAGGGVPSEVTDWASAAHLLRQRLLLRRASEHQVMTTYAGVLDALEAVSAAAEEAAYENAVTNYEQSMNAFLATARASLDAAVSE